MKDQKNLQELKIMKWSGRIDLRVWSIMLREIGVEARKKNIPIYAVPVMLKTK